MNPVAAARPEQEFNDAFKISEITGGGWAGRVKYFGFEMRNISINLFQCDADGHRSAGESNGIDKGVISQNGRSKPWIKERREAGRGKWQTIIAITHR